MKYRIAKIVTQHALLAVALPLAMLGCVDQAVRSDTLRPAMKLETGKTIAIARPSNAAYNKKEYPGSGSATAQALRTAFETKGKAVISDDCHDFDCINKTTAFDYALVSVISHWEDHMTEYNGKRDVIVLSLTVYNERGVAIATTTINARSRWATYGGITPSDLLVDPLFEYANTLF